MGNVALVVLIALVGIWILIYNTLVRRRNRVEQAYATIDVQLVQRYDLIPKLVETVRQYMTHERSLLEEIVRLRTAAIGSTTPAERLRADNELTSALGQLRVAVENYPQLRASENFTHLQRSLNEVEEQIAAARRSYNSAVTDYNNVVQTFPSSFVAGMGQFHPEELYEAEAAKRADVDMRQLFKA